MITTPRAHPSLPAPSEVDTRPPLKGKSLLTSGSVSSFPPRRVAGRSRCTQSASSRGRHRRPSQRFEKMWKLTWFDPDRWAELRTPRHVDKPSIVKRFKTNNLFFFNNRKSPDRGRWNCSRLDSQRDVVLISLFCLFTHSTALNLLCQSCLLCLCPKERKTVAVQCLPGTKQN